jgi:signal transduction histidine kinase
MYGVERSTLLGQSLKAFTENVERGERVLYHALQTGSFQGLETRHRRLDGSVLDVLVNASVVAFEGREAILSIHRDVTERRQARAHMRRLKKFYENILDEVPVEIAVLDAEGRYRYLNEAGMSDPALRRWIIGKTDVDYARKRGRDMDLYRERYEWTLDLIERKEANRRAEVQTTSAGEKEYVVRHETPVLDDEGAVRYVIGYTVDLTERRKYEEGLRRAKEEAEEASQVKDAIINNMSHELRTPLASMMGFADVLAETLDGQQEEQAEFARIIQRSGDRLQQTLQAVLELAQLEGNQYEVNPEAVDAAACAEQVVDRWQPRATEKGLPLSVQEAPPKAGAPTAEALAPHVRADKGALDRVLASLVANALKFTDKGEVIVEVGRLRPGDAPQGRRMTGTRDAAENERVFVRVRDNGVGISEDFMPRLFEEFEQESKGLNRRHEGVGLGLAITQRLVDLMEGAVYVESERGVGTSVTVCLPAAEER